MTLWSRVKHHGVILFQHIKRARIMYFGIQPCVKAHFKPNPPKDCAGLFVRRVHGSVGWRGVQL